MTWIEQQNIDFDWSWPADHEYIHFMCISSKMTVKITVKLQMKRKLHLFLSFFQICSSKRNETLREGSPWNLGFKRSCFGSSTKLMTSRPPSFTKSREHCHSLSFYPIFLKFKIWVALLITRSGIVSQHSATSNLGQNDGWKNR